MYIKLTQTVTTTKEEDALLQIMPGVLACQMWEKGSNAGQGNFRVIPYDTDRCTSTSSHMVSWSSQRADEGISCKCVCGPCKIINGESLSRQTHVHQHIFICFYNLIYKSFSIWMPDPIHPLFPASGNGLSHSPRANLPRRLKH